MMEILVRMSAWFSAIFYMFMTLVTLIIILDTTIELANILMLFMFVSMSLTGWFARKFRSTGFKIENHYKLLAVITLIFGVFFLILGPIILITTLGFKESYSVIFIFLVFFTPGIISALALLFGKSKKSTNN